MIREYKVGETKYAVEAYDEQGEDGWLGKVYVRGDIDDFTVPYTDVVEENVQEMLGRHTVLEFDECFPHPEFGMVYMYDAYASGS